VSFWAGEQKESGRRLSPRFPAAAGKNAAERGGLDERTGAGQACQKGRALLDAPPHHISAEATTQIAKDYEFLVLFTSTPGFPGDIGLAQAIKKVNPQRLVTRVRRKSEQTTSLPKNRKQS
jgi:hypothetical protein